MNRTISIWIGGGVIIETLALMLTMPKSISFGLAIIGATILLVIAIHLMEDQPITGR